jgi:hypothetical protein
MGRPKKGVQPAVAKVRTEHKDALMESGKWPDFVHFRDELKAQGVKNAEANRRAVREFLGDEAAKHAGESLPVTGKGAVKKPKVPKAPKILSIPPPDPVPAAGRDSWPAPSGGGTQPVASLPALPDSVDWSEKRASRSECVDWVARNMDNPMVRPGDCPDPAAWNLLSHCRESALARKTFWESYVRPSKTASEAPPPDEIDGSVQVDTIDKILGLKRKSEQNCGIAQLADRRAHNSEATGSNPVPATNLEEALT